MSAIVGTWDLRLKTPIGTLAVVYRFAPAADGVDEPPGAGSGDAVGGDAVGGDAVGGDAVGGDAVGGAGRLTGTAESRGETVPLVDLAWTDTEAGQRVTWRQSVTRPLRLNLTFDVVVAGDTLTGHSQAGRLPRTTVTGRRRALGSG